MCDSDIKLEHDCKIMVEMILEHLEYSPTAILLCGGYGRGEGAWFIDKNGLLCAYNDYDIAIISNQTIDYSELQSLRKQIAQNVGIRWVDIDFYTVNQVLSFNATIKHYDLLYASKLIYGSIDSIKSKYIDARDVGVEDVITLYWTRMWTFLGSWSGDFHDLDIEEARFFRNQMAKAVLAGCDAILIPFHEYSPSYKCKAVNASNYVDNKKWRELIGWAYEEKIMPSSGMLKKEDMVSLYTSCRDFYCYSMETGLGYLWKFFRYPKLTKKYYYIRTTHLLHVIYNLFIRHTLRPEKALEIKIAQNYIFWAYGNNNPAFFYAATKILNRWKYDVPSTLDWNQLRIAVSEARNKI